MKHQHLPVTLRPSSNPDRRSADFRRNHRRHFPRNTLDIKTRHARAVQRHRIAHELLNPGETLPLDFVPAHHIYRLWRQPDVPRHRNLGVNNLPNQVGTLLPAFNLYDFSAAFFHKARGVADRSFGVDLIGPVGHVGDQQRVLHPAPHRLHVMQHLVHRDRERVLVAQHGLSQRIAHQHHVDASLIHQTRGGVVVSGKASDGFVAEFLFPQGCGRNFVAGAVEGTADRGDAHDVLQCPSASGG